jgi:hypothetical protein
MEKFTNYQRTANNSGDSTILQKNRKLTTKMNLDDIQIVINSKITNIFFKK